MILEAEKQSAMEPKGPENGIARLVVQYDDHPTFTVSGLCSLVAHQSLVDVAIRCGNQTLQAHKVILAANSAYFRQQLESNPRTEQIITTGLDFLAMKNIIEFIYCGETRILEKNLKYVVAAAKLFQIRGLQAIGSEAADGDEIIYIQPPLFVDQKPKYSSAFPFSQMDSEDFDLNLPMVMNYGDMSQSLLQLPHPSEGPMFPPPVGSPSEVMFQDFEGAYVKVNDVVCEINGEGEDGAAIGALTPPDFHAFASASFSDSHDDADDEENAERRKDHIRRNGYNESYYGEEHFRRLDGMDAGVKEDLDMLMHFRREDALPEFHMLEPRPRVIAENIEGGASERIGDAANSDETEAMDGSHAKDDATEETVEDDEPFKTMPYDEKMGGIDNVQLTIEDEGDSD